MVSQSKGRDAGAESARRLDAESRRWLDGLTRSDSRGEETVSRLHQLLLRVARHEASRRRGWHGGVSGPELDDIAHQATADALITVTARLGEFRGASRFTTWACKFVMFEVSGKMARHQWRKQPPVLDEDALRSAEDRLSPQPSDRAEERERLTALHNGLRDSLTAHQRTVFVAAALNEVSIDVLALQLGSNRNAVYKALFDARRKLRACLAAAGYPLAEESTA